MEKNNAIIAAVVVVIVIIAAVGAYLVFGSNSGSDDGTDTGDTGDGYYFYLDGFDGTIDGWYTADASDVQSAFEAAMADAGIDVNISEYGMITIEDYVGGSSFDETTGEYVGTGTSVYVWTATSNVFNEYSNYFAAGPVLSDVTGNIVYLSYSTYTMGDDGVTDYDLNPATTEADLVTGGPFAEGSGYEPLSYSGEFSFYLDGFSDEIDGWYTAEADNVQAAFEAAMADAGISVNISEYGMITIEDYVGGSSYDEETGEYVGTGTSIYTWTSGSMVFNEYSNYFAAGPVLSDVTGNIVYLSYSTYTMGDDGVTDYDLNPASTEADLITGGPFATA